MRVHLVILPLSDAIFSRFHFFEINVSVKFAPPLYSACPGMRVFDPVESPYFCSDFTPSPPWSRPWRGWVPLPDMTAKSFPFGILFFKFGICGMRTLCDVPFLEHRVIKRVRSNVAQHRGPIFFDLLNRQFEL